MEAPDARRLSIETQEYLKQQAIRLELLSNVVYGRESSGVLVQGWIELMVCSNAVLEWDSLNHLRQSFKPPNPKPALLSRLHQFEYQRQNALR